MVVEGDGIKEQADFSSSFNRKQQGSDLHFRRHYGQLTLTALPGFFDNRLLAPRKEADERQEVRLTYVLNHERNR